MFELIYCIPNKWTLFLLLPCIKCYCHLSRLIFKTIVTWTWNSLSCFWLKKALLLSWNRLVYTCKFIQQVKASIRHYNKENEFIYKVMLFGWITMFTSYECVWYLNELALWNWSEFKPIQYLVLGCISTRLGLHCDRETIHLAVWRPATLSMHLANQVLQSQHVG